MFFVAHKILFTYLLNLEVLVPTTNIATTIRPSMLPIGAPQPAVGVPVRSDESTQPFHPTLPLNDEIVFTAWKTTKKMEMETKGREEIGEEKRFGVVYDGEEDEWKLEEGREEEGMG
nr:hypothetical protein CFP56_25301 [Quercus suber]